MDAISNAASDDHSSNGAPNHGSGSNNNNGGGGSMSLSAKDKVALPRGEACLQCRRRKLRCDAVKPACSKCVKSGRGEACEYQDTHYLVTIQTLEDQVRQLQDRLTSCESGMPMSMVGFGAPHPHQLTPGHPHHPMSLGMNFGMQLGMDMDDISRLPTNLPFSAFLGGSPATTPGGISPGPLMMPRMHARSYSSSTSIPTLASLASSGSISPNGPLSPTGIMPRPTRSMSTSSVFSLQDMPQTPEGLPAGSDPALVMSMSNLGVVEPAPLGPSTVGSSASRALLQTFAAHAARFGFPRHSLERLPNVTPALLEAIYALACRMGGSSCLSLAYDIDARALERSFLHRAEVALGRPDESGSPYLALELVQAQALLANLMYILGRPMDGHRHAGGALRLATSLRLQHASVADERAETWWMVYAVDRAWASVTGASPSPIDESSVTAPFPGTVPSPDASLDGPVNGLGHGVPSALDMLCMPPTFGIDVADPTAAAMGLSGSGEALGAARFKVLALHARAQEIIASCSLGRPMPQAMLAHASSGLDAFTATSAALSRLVAGLSLMPRGPATATVRLEAQASIVALNCMISNNDAAAMSAREAFAEVASLTAAEIDMLDPVVGFCLYNIVKAWRDLNGDPFESAPLESALDRLGDVMPYVAAYRSGEVSAAQAFLSMQTY